MKVQDIRSIETKDLLVKVEEFKKELFSLRFQQATGQLENCLLYTSDAADE